MALWTYIFLLILATDIGKRNLALMNSNPSVLQVVKDTFPNPRIDYLLCNRRKPSFICDPDSILNSREGDKLDSLALELHQSSPCLCATCTGKVGGAQIGIFMKHNLTTSNFTISEASMTGLAKQIRQTWRLGKCSDDIVVIVLATAKIKSAFDMGTSVQHVLPLEKASRIFNECVGHFDNGNYLQGLESIINSFRDELQRYQRIIPAKTKKKNALIIGISTGTGILVLMVAVATAIRCRQIRKRSVHRQSKKGKTYSGFENVTDTYKYSIYTDPVNKADEHSSNSSSDEGIDSDNEEGGRESKQYDSLKLPVPPRFSSNRGRQLSDVLEETQEDEETAAIKYAMTNVPRNCNVNVTEL